MDVSRSIGHITPHQNNPHLFAIPRRSQLDEFQDPGSFKKWNFIAHRRLCHRWSIL